MENHGVPGSSDVWEVDLLAFQGKVLLAVLLGLVLAGWCCHGAALAASSSLPRLPVLPFLLGMGPQRRSGWLRLE